MNQWFKWFVVAKFTKGEKNNPLRLFLLRSLKYDPSIVHSFILENFDTWAREYVDTKNVNLMSHKASDTDEIVAYMKKRFARDIAKI